MKITPAAACAAVMACALTLGACSNDADEAAKTTAAATSAAEAAPATAAEVAPMPTAEELNEVLARATDPNLPVEEKVSTVQDGDSAPELFETMTRSKEESGADFQVVNPVLPGYAPNSVLASVSYTLPERPAEIAKNVEFVYEDGQWKLSRSWACTLITNTVSPDQVPAMCQSEVAPMPAPAADAPAEGEQPAPAEGEQPAPAEGEQPAPAEAPAN
ncbi:hypothetical protein [Corynebacterium aquilae]|uniref:Low molecular weight antigen MTB12-like C-terminal domain-containing protein n=1 Tax=Corynebacterium aquilae DSM 44791 TaxID=1431546 RepID=A0A1L7CGX4_9CORY|nr:hypothetical protein [Corynebacterium aquilae]APT85079.1 hypothetical protein CAQU_08360 [Corynebacterium aquilae DSM 44791]